MTMQKVKSFNLNHPKKLDCNIIYPDEKKNKATCLKCKKNHIL